MNRHRRFATCHMLNRMVDQQSRRVDHDSPTPGLGYLAAQAVSCSW